MFYKSDWLKRDSSWPNASMYDTYAIRHIHTHKHTLYGAAHFLRWLAYINELIMRFKIHKSKYDMRVFVCVCVREFAARQSPMCLIWCCKMWKSFSSAFVCRVFITLPTHIDRWLWVNEWGMDTIHWYVSLVIQPMTATATIDNGSCLPFVRLCIVLYDFYFFFFFLFSSISIWLYLCLYQ